VVLQAKRIDIERADRAAARKHDAIVAITQPIHAAAAWLILITGELRQTGDRDGKSLRVKRFGRQLEQVLDRDLILALLPDLAVDDRINLLMIFGTMRAALAMAEVHSTHDVLSSDEISGIGQVLGGLKDHLARFHRKLHDSFVRGIDLAQAGHA